MSPPEQHPQQLEPPTGAPAAAAPPARSPRGAAWRVVREALAGSRRDLTEEPLGQAIILLAVPMVMEMIMESVFAIADIFWVSKLGPDAIAAVGLTETVLAIVYAIAIGLAMGAAAVVARRIGAREPDAAARAGVQAIVIGLAVGAFIGVLGAATGPALLRLMGASPATAEVGGGYVRLMLGSSVVIVLLFMVNAIFRGAGDAAIAMRTLWLANGINIMLAPFLVFGWGPFPRLGVTGAALATTIGRGTGILYQLAALRRGGGHLDVRRQHVRLDPVVLAGILRVSRSGVVQTLVGFTSWVVLIRILAPFGSAALAGYTIAMRVVQFALMPSWGLGSAAATLVGQNLGAGRPQRAEQAVRRAAVYNLIFLSAVGLTLASLAPAIVGLFSSDPAVAAYGSRCLRVVSAGFPLYAFGMVVTQAFNGAGDTRTPTMINFVCFWVCEIPVGYLLAGPAGLGPTGVFVAITVAFSLVAVLGVALFRRGRWRTVRV